MSAILSSRLKKAFISLFILSSLWIMVATNLGLRLPKIFPSHYTAESTDSIVSKINWYIERTDWWINYLGWVVGLKNYWRMFSPVDRFNWQMEFSAVHADGSTTLLPLPHQTRRNFWQRNFADFREAKFYLNIYNRKAAQQFFAQYLCRTYPDLPKPIVAINIELHSQNILSPEEARYKGVYLEPRINKRPWAMFSCQHSSQK